jgi:hypothetical protein
MNRRASGRARGKRSLSKALAIALITGLSWLGLHGIARAEGFVLTGLVLLSDRGDGIAYLLEPSLTNNEVMAVRRGDTIGPYRLTRILDDRVELEGPAGTVVVPVRGGGSAVAAGRGAASPPRSAADARTEPAPTATDTAGREAVTSRRSSRNARVPFAEAMRERIRAMRKDLDDKPAGDKDAGDKQAEARAHRSRVNPHMQLPPQGVPASVTLTDIIRPQAGPSGQAQGASSVLAPLLGPR